MGHIRGHPEVGHHCLKKIKSEECNNYHFKIPKIYPEDVFFLNKLGVTLFKPFLLPCQIIELHIKFLPTVL